MGGKGSGAKPKQYDPALVAIVADLYRSGMTQNEVAESCGISQKVVWKLMVNHDIERRPQIKRNQWGALNSSWKGSSVGYQGAHLRVASVRGKPSLCAWCGTATAKRFEWANLSGNYHDPADYVRLCSSCHHKMDGTIRNINGKEVSNA